MCRICGRMIKCIFDTMPSRIPRPSTRSFSTAIRAQRSNRASTHVAPRPFSHSISGLENKPALSLPFRARLHTATATQQDVHSQSSHLQSSSELPPSMLQTTSQAQTPSVNDSSQPSSRKPLVLSKSLQSLLPALTAQKPHYITTHIHRFPYLITAGDTLRLPFYMHGVSAGDVLRLNRASLLGSRDYTLKAGTNSTETYDRKRTGEPNYLDERLFEVRATVMGVDSGPMAKMEKTKRRNRKTKTVTSKHRYTVLKITEVKVKTLEELKAEGSTLLLES